MYVLSKKRKQRMRRRRKKRGRKWRMENTFIEHSNEKKRENTIFFLPVSYCVIDHLKVTKHPTNEPFSIFLFVFLLKIYDTISVYILYRIKFGQKITCNNEKFKSMLYLKYGIGFRSSSDEWQALIIQCA